jgi:hypothetical protein
MTEKELKKYLIDKLNNTKSGWTDGDKENPAIKTADLVNNKLKIAIEIKEDTVYKRILPPLNGEIIEESLDLNNLSERLKADARDANKKFRNYPDYKTILMIKTELVDGPSGVIGYIFAGLQRFSKPKGEKTREIGRKNEFLSFTETKEIGSYLLFNGDNLYYIKNENVIPQRLISKEELEGIFSKKIKEINCFRLV